MLEATLPRAGPPPARGVRRVRGHHLRGSSEIRVPPRDARHLRFEAWRFRLAFSLFSSIKQRRKWTHEPLCKFLETRSPSHFLSIR